MTHEEINNIVNQLEQACKGYIGDTITLDTIKLLADEINETIDNNTIKFTVEITDNNTREVTFREIKL